MSSKISKVMDFVIELNDGSIVRVDLNPTRGSEQRKIRPCLVVECKASPLSLVLVMPITDAAGKRGKLLFLELDDLRRAGLDKSSVIDIYQIRAIDPIRIIKVLGAVSEEKLQIGRAHV